jgi:PDZ domain-containing protein
MRKLLTPWRLLFTGAGLLAIAFAILWFWPSGSYLLLPDKAHPVAPLISVKGGKRESGTGGIYFVDVIVQRASLLESLFPGIRSGSTLVPGRAIKTPGVNDAARIAEDQREMARSQQIAAAVALRALGYKVSARPTGALISQVLGNAPASGRLQPTDVVVAVDGRPVRTPSDLRRLIGRHHPGETIRLTVRGGAGLRQVTLKTVADPSDSRHAIIGVLVDQSAQITLPLSVRIDAQGVGGPSAGLAFALGLMEQLGRDVDRGYRVAATGELALDGSVVEIGAVHQKVLDARKTDVDVFLVPAGDNATEARKYARGLRVVPVKTFRQALHALATLPPKA